MTTVSRLWGIGRLAGWVLLGWLGVGSSLLVGVSGRALAAEEGEAKGGAAAAEEAPVLQLAGGAWSWQVPAGWEVGRPRVTMVEHEIKVPRAEGDTADGRLTMMAAGGSVQANVDRWVGQFKNPQGPKIDKIKVGDAEVQVVELSGTFQERAGGPVTPPTDRPNYRLLGAIIPLGDNGNYFLKLTGPDKTIADNADAFRKAVESLKKGR